MAGNAAPVAPLPPVPDGYPAEWLNAGRPSGHVTFEDGPGALAHGEASRPGGSGSRVTVEP